MISLRNKSCGREKPWGVTTLVTGHYHPWGDKEPKKKKKKIVYSDKGSDSFKIN